MCGIVGVWDKNKNVQRIKLKAMTDALAHRGPDGEGFFISNNKNLGLGHRRLAIIDLSTQADQPMSFDGLTIVFNGEIYNYKEIRKNLEDKGYVFDTQSDTEVLLKAYHKHGSGVLEYIDGMFAFAIWNELKQELFCVRDRFGEKPFYYYIDNSQFVFASEMKALWEYGIPKEVNWSMIYKYLAYDLVENPINKEETFFKNIKKLPVGFFMTIDLSFEVKKTKYWGDIPKKSLYKENEAIEKFKELLTNSIRLRLQSDVSAGSSLSGGIDSSSVVAIISKMLGEVNVFTAAFREKEYDESKYVNILKEKYPLNSFFIYPDVNIFENKLDKIFYHQEEPFGSGSIVAQWSVMELAKLKNNPVLLDGQGADETLAGYYKYIESFLIELFFQNKKEYYRQQQIIKKNLGIDNNISFIKLISKKYRYKLGNIKRKFEYSPFGVHRDFYKTYNVDINLFGNFISLNQHLWYDITQYGLEKLLRFADRNSMAHSIEVRLPFLEHNLVAFILSLPASYKIRNGWTKWLLRQAMKDNLPQEIVWRRDKMSYQVPHEKWIAEKWARNRIKEIKSKLIKNNIITDKYTNDWSLIMLSYIV